MLTAVQLLQGAVAELRTEMRALASHLTAQQMGALAHLSIARGHTFPGGARGYQGGGIDWAPALRGPSSPPRAGLARRRVQLPRVPPAPPHPTPAPQLGTAAGPMEWMPRPRGDSRGGGAASQDQGGLPQSGTSGATAAEAGSGQPRHTPAAAAGPQWESAGGVGLPRAHDVTRAAAKRHARRRTAPAAQQPPAGGQRRAARRDGTPSALHTPRLRC